MTGPFGTLAQCSRAGIAKSLAHFLFLTALVTVSLICAISFHAVEANPLSSLSHLLRYITHRERMARVEVGSYGWGSADCLNKPE